MKNNIKYTILLMSFFLVSCCKDSKKNIPVFTKNILKEILVYSQTDSFVGKYTFLYDASFSKLIQVNKNDSAYYIITSISDKVVELEFIRRFLTGEIYHEKSYAHLNSNNEIKNIDGNSIEPDENFIFKGLPVCDCNTDTIQFYDVLPILSSSCGIYYQYSEIKYFDLNYQNGNCLQYKNSFINRSSSECLNLENDTNIVNMTYGNIINEGFIPLQGHILEFFYDESDWMDPLYVLGINSLYMVKPNKNLWSIKESYSFTLQHNTYYEYILNDKKQIIEMRYRQGSTSNKPTIFKFKYY